MYYKHITKSIQWCLGTYCGYTKENRHCQNNKFSIPSQNISISKPGVFRLGRLDISNFIVTV